MSSGRFGRKMLHIVTNKKPAPISHPRSRPARTTPKLHKAGFAYPLYHSASREGYNMAKKLRTAQARWIEDKQHWKVNVQADGSTRKSFYSSTPGKRGKSEAERKADEWLDANCPDNIKFGAAWKQYIEKVKNTTGTGNYLNIEMYGRLYILPELEYKKLSKVTVADMDKIIEKVAAQGLSKRTCENTRSAFVGLYRFSKKNNWRMVEPENLTIPTTAPVGERTILQPSEVMTVFTRDTRKRYGKDIPFFYIHAIRFALVMGYRSGEERGFRHEDLSCNGTVITVRRAINRLDEETRGKNDNARRTAVLPALARKILDEQAQMLKRCGIDSPWLFPDEDGERLTNRKLYKGWISYAQTHGIRISLHELRHTWVSIMKSVMPDGMLKSVIGHSKSMDTYGVYGHMFGDDMELTAGYIDKAYERVLSGQAIPLALADTTQNTTFDVSIA